MASSRADLYTGPPKEVVPYLLDDLRFQYESTNKRAEQADALAAGLLTAAIAVGALIATALRDVKLPGMSVALIAMSGAGLFATCFLAAATRLAPSWTDAIVRGTPRREPPSIFEVLGDQPPPGRTLDADEAAARARLAAMTSLQFLVAGAQHATSRKRKLATATLLALVASAVLLGAALLLKVVAS